MANYCAKCNHTGLLPFVKNGKLIPHTFLHCECNDVYTDHYIPVQPADYDFPCSDTFRGYSFVSSGMADPGYVPVSRREPEPIEQPSRNLSPREWGEMQQLKGLVLHLQATINKKPDAVTVRRKGIAT